MVQIWYRNRCHSHQSKHLIFPLHSIAWNNDLQRVNVNQIPKSAKAPINPDRYRASGFISLLANHIEVHAIKRCYLRQHHPVGISLFGQRFWNCVFICCPCRYTKYNDDMALFEEGGLDTEVTCRLDISPEESRYRGLSLAFKQATVHSFTMGDLLFIFTLRWLLSWG